jgi:hypothetical protein
LKSTPGPQQPAHRRLRHRAAAFARDHHAALDLAELDEVRDRGHPRHEPEARVPDVVVEAGVGDAEPARHQRGDRRLEEVLAHRGADQRLDATRGRRLALEQLLRRQHGAIEVRLTHPPEPSRSHPGQRLEDLRRQADPLVERGQLLLEVRRRELHRRRHELEGLQVDVAVPHAPT